MKILIFASCLAAVGLNLHAQSGGTVTLGNNSSCKVINSQTGTNVVLADGVRVALVWSPNPSNNFTQIGETITNVGSPLPGLFAGGTRTAGTETPGGDTGLFQVRTWAGGFATYEEAINNGTVLVGQSAILNVKTGNPLPTNGPPTPPGSLTAGGLQSIIMALPPPPSYTNVLHPGVSLIANQLDHGSNTFTELFPNLNGARDGDIIQKWICTGYQAFHFDSSSPTGFSDGDGNPIPSGSLAPGEGAFYDNQQGVDKTIIFTGGPHVPVLPATLPCGTGHYNLLSRQTNDLGTYENIIGLAPQEGAMELIWDGAAFVSYAFSNALWMPGIPPNLRVGESAMFFIPSPVILPSITQQPVSLTVTQGQSATFTVSASSPTPIIFQWIFSVATNSNAGSNLDGATNSSLTLTNVQYNQAGYYSVIVSNASGAVTSSPALLMVNDTTPPIVHCPGNLTRYVCGSAIRVFYHAWAQDDSSGTVNLSYNPPSGSYFTAGTTTIVNVTATDASGNTTGCSFTVTVIETSIWQTLPGGNADCFGNPLESTTRSPCLNSAYPGVTWRPFDDSSVNRHFGQSWVNLPNGILNATLTTFMRPCLHHGGPHHGTSGQPENDSISLGLDVCNPVHWQWGRYIGSGNSSAGLLSVQWRTQGGCGVSFTFGLGALPPDTSLLPQINNTHRFDMYVQDDTAVDYAWLKVRYCPPPHILGGLGASANNAIISYGPNTWLLACDPAITPTNYDVHVGLGEAFGVRSGLITTDLNAASNGVLAVVLSTLMPDETTNYFGINLVRTNGQDGAFVNLQPITGTPLIAAKLSLLLHGTELVSQVIGPGQLPSALSLPVIETDFVAFTGGSNMVLHLVSPAQFTGPFGPVTADEVQFSISGDADWMSGVLPRYLDISATNVLQVGLHDFALEMNGRFHTVGDTALAQVNGNQLVLSPLEPESAQPVTAQFALFQTSEFRLSFGTPFISPAPSNASLSLITRGVAAGGERDLPALRFDNSGSNWNLTCSSNGVPSGLARVLVLNSGLVLANVANPTNVSVSELPTLHWPGVTWFADADICHRFPFRAPTVLEVNGVVYQATELRVLTATNGLPIEGLAGDRVEAVRADFLALSLMGVGPESYHLEIPEIGEEVMIRWEGLGGVLETATDIGGPWTIVPGGVGGEVTIPYDDAPSRYFRVRSE